MTAANLRSIAGQLRNLALGFDEIADQMAGDISVVAAWGMPTGIDGLQRITRFLAEVGEAYCDLENAASIREIAGAVREYERHTSDLIGALEALLDITPESLAVILESQKPKLDPAMRVSLPKNPDKKLELGPVSGDTRSAENTDKPRGSSAKRRK